MLGKNYKNITHEKTNYTRTTSMVSIALNLSSMNHLEVDLDQFMHWINSFGIKCEWISAESSSDTWRDSTISTRSADMKPWWSEFGSDHAMCNCWIYDTLRIVGFSFIIFWEKGTETSFRAPKSDDQMVISTEWKWLSSDFVECFSGEMW